MQQFRGTTIVSARRNGKVTIAGDGQVSIGNTVMKGNASVCLYKGVPLLKKKNGVIRIPIKKKRSQKPRFCPIFFLTPFFF